MTSLTNTEAQRRAALLKVRSYHVDLDLTTGADTFRSTTRVSFAATTPGADTFIDVKPRTLHSAALNGVELDVATMADGRLALSGLAADNELVVVADMNYSREGEGLHRYTDPGDDRVYLYAQSFLDNAPRILACFDQPDLKATFAFNVKAPTDWKVLGTGRATETEPGHWTLEETKPLSTYLVALVAGPYAAFHSEHDGIPMGFHCRQSLAEALKADVQELFEITGQFLDEYHRLFGVRYPFGKCDIVFVPEFNTLAMENPACISIRDHYVFRSERTEGDLEDRAVIIAHELSHMWFGNLVTMRWWGELWLNEGFADYVGHRVPTEVTRYTKAVTTWSAGRKGQAVLADQRPSTHPVSAEEVATAQDGLMNLDRISYYKGSSILRQLATRIGEEAYRNGLRTYFQRHAWGNTSYRDLLDAFAEASGQDLTEWAKLWLLTANLNTLSLDLKIEDGRIASAAIVQTAPESHPVLRPHTLDIGLYGARTEVVRVDVEGPRTELPQLTGKPAPHFVLLNEDDLAYVKLRFDPMSWQALPKMLPRLSDVNRAMVWGQLLLGVFDGVVPGADYLAIAAEVLPAEPVSQIIAEVLSKARVEVADRYLNPAERDTALVNLAAACRQLLAVPGNTQDRQLTVFRSLIELTADVAELRGWLTGAGLPAEVTLDAELKWRILYRLSVLGDVTVAEVDAAYEADKSAQGEQYQAKCRAAMPTPEAKAWAWQAIMSDTSLSNHKIFALGEGFWQPEQNQLTESYVERFFAEAPALAKLRGDQTLEMLLRFLYPGYAVRQRTLDLSDELLRREDISIPLRRKVIDLGDDLRRAVRVRVGTA